MCVCSGSVDGTVMVCVCSGSDDGTVKVCVCVFVVAVMMVLSWCVCV